MKCSQCGNKLPDDAKYCDRCGVQVESQPDGMSSLMGGSVATGDLVAKVVIAVSLLAILLGGAYYMANHAQTDQSDSAETAKSTETASPAEAPGQPGSSEPAESEPASQEKPVFQEEPVEPTEPAEAAPSSETKQLSHDFAKAWMGDWVYENGQMVTNQTSISKRCQPFIDPDSALYAEFGEGVNRHPAEEGSTYYSRGAAMLFMDAYVEQLDDRTCLVGITFGGTQNDVVDDLMYARILRSHATEWWAFTFNEKGLLTSIESRDAGDGQDLWYFSPTQQYADESSANPYLDEAWIEGSEMILSGVMRAADNRSDASSGYYVGPDTWRYRLGEVPALMGIGVNKVGEPTLLSVEDFSNAMQTTGLPLCAHVVGDHVVYADLAP